MPWGVLVVWPLPPLFHHQETSSYLEQYLRYLFPIQEVIKDTNCIACTLRSFLCLEMLSSMNQFFPFKPFHRTKSFLVSYLIWLSPSLSLIHYPFLSKFKLLPIQAFLHVTNTNLIHPFSYFYCFFDINFVHSNIEIKPISIEK